MNNSPLGCIAVYLEPLEYGFWSPLPKRVMEILQMYDITVAQLVPNAWVSILSLIVTFKLKQLECMALAFSYLHIIQHNVGGKG